MTEKNPYERAILARLESKAEDAYLWPRWPAAYEAGQAALEVADQETAELRAESARLASVVAKAAALADEWRNRDDLRASDHWRGLDFLDGKAFGYEEAADILGALLHSSRAECSETCAPHLHQHCSPECERECPACTAAIASVGVSGSADDRREANASQAPDTATPGEVPPGCLTHAHIPWNNWCKPAASSVDDKAGE